MTALAIGVQAIVALLIASVAFHLAALGILLLWLAIQSACGALASQLSTLLRSLFSPGVQT